MGQSMQDTVLTGPDASSTGLTHSWRAQGKRAAVCSGEVCCCVRYPLQPCTHGEEKAGELL